MSFFKRKNRNSSNEKKLDNSFNMSKDIEEGSFADVFGKAFKQVRHYVDESRIERQEELSSEIESNSDNVNK